MKKAKKTDSQVPRSDVPAEALQPKPGTGSEQRPMMAELHRRAESQLKKLPVRRRSRGGGLPKDRKSKTLVHELQVHQVELEMQNQELQEARFRVDILLEKYTDLYDFAPVGYFTLSDAGTIVTANLTGAGMIGMDRSQLIGRNFAQLISPQFRLLFSGFLKKVFVARSKQTSDFEMLCKGQLARPVNIEAQRSANGDECRLMVVNIKERKQAADLLRMSEVRYRRLFEAAHDGVLLLDPGTRKITDANPFMTQLLGYTHEQLVGRELFEIGLLKDESTSKEMFRKLKRMGQVRYENLPLESQDGRHQEVEVVANLYQESSHSVIQCNIRDITERKQAADDLRVSEVRYRRLFEAAHDGVLIIDPATRKITDANPFMTKLLGYSHEQLVGRELFEIGLLKDKAANKEMFQRLKTNREARYENLPLESQSGRHQEVEVVANLYQENGHSVIQCNIRDITERKRAADLLQRNEAIFSALVSQAPVGVYVVDANLCLQQANPTAMPIFRKVKPLVGRSLREVLRTIWPGKVAESILNCFRTTLKTGVPYQSPDFVERRRDTGIKEFYEWQIQRVTLPGGEYGVVCFFNNVTERKNVEEVRRRVDVLAASNIKLEKEIVRRISAEKSLKKSEQNLSGLLKESRQLQEQMRHLSRGIITVQEDERRRISRELHDVIAQTLTGINFRLFNLKRDADLGAKDFGNNLVRTQQLVKESIDSVQDFARELRPAVLDDLGLIPALHTFMNEFTTLTGVRTHLKVFSGVELLDSARKTVLYRIAQESFTNISRHAKASRVDVNIRKVADAIVMQIKDNGKSFDTKRIPQMKGNHGLGLLGMRERLEMVGGTFEVRSSPGKGTTIVAKFPQMAPTTKRSARPGPSQVKKAKH